MVRRYIENIFKCKVEESMAEIERLRKSLKRYDQKTEISGNNFDKVWRKSDLFTAQGSIFALAVLLLDKIDE